MSLRRDNSFAQIPEWLLFSGASSNAIRLYAVLWTRADYGTHQTGTYSPSVATLAKDCGDVSPTTIRRALAELEKLGALRITRRVSESGDNLPNDYLLISARPADPAEDTPGVLPPVEPPPSKTEVGGGSKTEVPPTTSGTPPTSTGGTLSRPSLFEIPGGAPEPTEQAATNELVGEWIDGLPARPPSGLVARMGRQIKALLEEGTDVDLIRNALTLWSEKGNTPESLPSFVFQSQRDQSRAARADEPRPGTGRMVIGEPPEEDLRREGIIP